MSDDVVSKLLDQVNKMSIDISAIKASLGETDKLTHEVRIRNLENTVSQWTGGKILIVWLLTTGIAVYAALKH